MDTGFIQISPQALALVPIVMALTSLLKMYVDAKWSPLFSLFFGIAGAFVFPAATAGVTILAGLIIGLTASGLYSGVKTVATTTTA